MNNSEHIQDSLSAAEREALGLDDGDEVSIDSLLRAGKDEEGQSPESDDDAGQLANINAEQPANKQEAPAPKADAAPPTVEANPAISTVTAAPVENLASKVAELDGAIAVARQERLDAQTKLQEQREYGEVNDEAYKKALADIEAAYDEKQTAALTEKTQLVLQQQTFEKQTEQQTKDLTALWLSDVAKFADDMAKQGYDYRSKENPMLSRLFNDEVQKLNQLPETGEWSNQDLLKKAHENLLEQLNKSGFKAVKAKPSAKQVPPNIGGMSAALNPSLDLSDSSFQELESLVDGGKTGFTLERAAARLSEKDLEKWAFGLR